MMAIRLRFTLSTMIICNLLLSLSMIYTGFFTQKAYADGLTQENLPPATVGNRKASLFVKVSPPILTTDTRGNTYMQFRLFDANTNQTIQHVTYDLTVTRGTSTVKQGAKPLLRDFFHAHSGLLTLKIEPSNGTLTIFGERDPFQNAWVADPGGSVNIRGPILLEGGLYHIHIEIFGIDNDRNIFIPDQAPKFDSYLSVGDVYRNNIVDPTNGQKYNTTLISYYDKIHGFKFDPNTKEITWSMPFDWDLSRIKKQNIFVHEELRLPKLWKDFVGNGFAGAFNASVNEIPITGRSLAIDPFSFPNVLVLHYLINKNELIKLAEIQKQQQSTSTSVTGNNHTTATATPTTSLTSSGVTNATIKTGFGIIPNSFTGTNSSINSGTTNKPRIILVAANISSNSPKNTTSSSAISTNFVAKDQQLMTFGLKSNVASSNKTSAAMASSSQTSSDLSTDTGAIHVIVSWSPNQLSPNKASNVKVDFSDALTSGPLNANLKYDLMILNKNGTEVIKKENLLAKNGQDTQAITFPSKDIYQIELRIKALQRTGQLTPDLSRNGIARGYVVVPEFPSATTTAVTTMAMIGGLFSVLLLVQRMNNYNPRRKDLEGEGE
jgi:hypothetical protein